MPPGGALVLAAGQDAGFEAAGWAVGIEAVRQIYDAFGAEHFRRRF